MRDGHCSPFACYLPIVNYGASIRVPFNCCFQLIADLNLNSAKAAAQNRPAPQNPELLSVPALRGMYLVPPAPAPSAPQNPEAQFPCSS